ncbi:WD40 repeat domain-containing protein [Streptomyces broussonetiae]|uniref:Uncharacterized protein n=1 Tax=Streptomyces broussonetiae TaxID=2686304 RepID=A0A6I6NAI3_9ACTN|nr:hypothetical protein [Streptomyces broussonetiae]QHA06950.1 hypothetical protein GQF42_29905 [Streptomyces broussonetiae]
MLRADTFFGRLILALAATPPDTTAPGPDRPGARWVTALAARPLSPEFPSVRPARPRPPLRRTSPRARWLPVLLTGVLVVLACLTAAAVQSVLPAPWQNEVPEQGVALRPEQWRAGAGPLRRAGTAAFAPDGRTLVTVAGSTTELWDTTTPDRPERVASERGAAGVTALSVSPDGQALVTAGTQGVRALALASGRPLWSVNGIAGQVKALLVTERGVLLAASRANGTTELTEVPLGHEGPLAPIALSRLSGSARSAQFTPDGRLLALAETSGAVRLWNLADPRHPQAAAPPFASGSKDTGALAFSRDGRMLATVNDGRTVCLWDVSDPAHPHRLGHPLTDGERITGIAFSPDARLVATVNANGTASLWKRRPLTGD